MKFIISSILIKPVDLNQSISSSISLSLTSFLLKIIDNALTKYSYTTVSLFCEYVFGRPFSIDSLYSFSTTASSVKNSSTNGFTK